MNIKPLLKKELAFYFNNPIGYITAILFAVFSNFLFMKDLFLRGDTSMRSFFEIAPWLLLIFIPALGMRVFAEEKRINTIETLITLPVYEATIVLAKFIALLIFAAITLLLTISIPFSLALLGKVVVSEIIVSYIGVILYSMGLIAISIYFSSTTKNQILAFLFSIIVGFLLMVVGSDFLSSVLPNLIQEWLSFLSPIYHYENFLKGVLDLRSVGYFISLSLTFIFLTIINLEKRD
jgi:ABC-2 type transport system permease protein